MMDRRELGGWAEALESGANYYDFIVVESGLCERADDRVEKAVDDFLRVTALNRNLSRR